MNHQNSNQIHVASAKRGKSRVNKSQLLLILLLIGRESGARFLSQPQAVAMQNQSNREITLEKRTYTIPKQTWIFYTYHLIENHSKSRDKNNRVVKLCQKLLRKNVNATLITRLKSCWHNCTILRN